MSTQSVKLPECLQKIRPATSPERDYSTNSNYFNFVVENTTLNFEILFKEKILKGFVEYDLTCLKPSDAIIMDANFLAIDSVEVAGERTKFDVEKANLGDALKIFLPRTLHPQDKVAVKVQFATTESSIALQFLSKEQTDGKKAEYLFSQSEPIHARSIYPCFDTPSVKSPYKVVVKSPYNTLVSALPDKEAQSHETAADVYHFVQPVPIPAYLFAIVSGDVTGAAIGPRSTIFTEPVNIARCANEFKDEIVEKFIKVLEDLIFPYEWTSYDFVVAPMAFPYGGMENPQLTLANSTIISGDGENIDVIAHELAHSYSGNLVTNGSWEHFWLNEGWTVYLERRILRAIHGESYRHFSAVIGWNDLADAISSMSPKFTRLIQDLKDGSDPDDAFSTVPYEKGFNFLFHLENTVGGVEHFDPFIKHYFTTFSKKSLDTYQFIETLFEFYQQYDAEIFAKLEKVDYETWLLKPGMPPKPKFDESLITRVIDLAKKWEASVSSGEVQFSQKFSKEDVADLSSNQLVVFLEELVNSPEFVANSKDAISFMEENYERIMQNNNAEVKFKWFKLVLTCKVTKYYQVCADWLGTVGRMKFVRPGYVLLSKCDKDLATKTFLQNEKLYHPICVAMVKKDIGL